MGKLWKVKIKASKNYIVSEAWPREKENSELKEGGMGWEGWCLRQERELKCLYRVTRTCPLKCQPDSPSAFLAYIFFFTCIEDLL